MSNDKSDSVEAGTFFQNIKDAILCLGLPASKLLSHHAAHKHHEDVPDGAVRAPAVAAPADPLADAILSSIPVIDPKCPARLCPVLPPANFGAVVPRSVYRSSYPQPENFGFVKSLGLKTILTLVPGEISTQYSHFMMENDIQHFQVPLPANKGSIKVDACQMSKALGIILDRANHPVLIHCNKGKHRTGCVVGCLRKVQGEDMETIYSEYHIYAGEKARILDEGYMELFDVNTVLWMARRFNWISPDAEVAPLTQVPSLSPTRSNA